MSFLAGWVAPPYRVGHRVLPAQVDTDAQLLERWDRGDKQAGETLAERLFPPVFRFFASKLEREHARELVQRTFAAFAEARTSFRGEGSVRAFILGIARRQLLRALHRWDRNVQRVDGRVSSIADLRTSIPSKLARRARMASVLAALDEIPLDYRVALELYYWENLRVREIAEAVGASPAAVRMQLTRGRRLLKAQLPAGVMGEPPTPQR